MSYFFGSFFSSLKRAELTSSNWRAELSRAFSDFEFCELSWAELFQILNLASWAELSWPARLGSVRAMSWAIARFTSNILSRLSVELPRGNILMQIYENAEEPKERGNDFFFLNRKSQNVSLPYRKKTCMVWPQKFICSQLEISLFMSDTCLEDSVALYVAILEKK